MHLRREKERTSQNEHGAKNADAGDRVRTSIKNLRHRLGTCSSEEGPIGRTRGAHWPLSRPSLLCFEGRSRQHCGRGDRRRKVTFPREARGKVRSASDHYAVGRVMSTWGVHARFVGSIPDYYERFLAPLLFAPYARDLACRIEIGATSRILELAAGTGQLTRELVSVMEPGARLVATDLNGP